MTDREIVAITGGRDRTPTPAELERLAEMLAGLGAKVLRHGDCKPRRNADGELVGSTDTHVAAWVQARGLATIAPWPADWKRYGKPAGPIRNREMLSGRRPGKLIVESPARTLIVFEGGTGTKDCALAGYELGRVVLYVYSVAEPRIWNRHHGKPPGPSIYVGGNKQDPSKASPLANPWADQIAAGEDRATEAVRVLAMYKQWLWARLSKKNAWYDPNIVGLIRSLTPEHYLVCSCWPAHCHAEVIIGAWRWLQTQAA